MTGDQFNRWAAEVDTQICRLLGIAKNDVTAPYAEWFGERLSPMAAALRAIDYDVSQA